MTPLVLQEQLHRYEQAGLTCGQQAVATSQWAVKVAAMLARGTLVRPQLRASGGPLFLAKGARLRNPQFISHAGRLVLEAHTEVQGLSRDGVRFGDQVVLGAFSMVRPSGYYTRELGVGLVVGDRSSVGPYGYLGCSGGIVIGDDVMFGPAVRVFAEDHNFAAGPGTIRSQHVTWDPVTIEDDCWLGSGVTVTSGVTIGRGTVIGAGSVVTRDIPPYSVAAGSPARILRSRA